MDDSVATKRSQAGKAGCQTHRSTASSRVCSATTKRVPRREVRAVRIAAFLNLRLVSVRTVAHLGATFGHSDLSGNLRAEFLLSH